MILFTFVIVSVIMPSSSSSSFDLDDDDDMSSDHGRINHPSKKLECRHYNDTMEECGSNGRGCNKTVTCESRGTDPNPACFILWESKVTTRTDPSTGNTVEEYGDPVIKLKGCWSGHSASACSETSDCVERRKFAKKDLFFCCCRGDLCNNDFTHEPTDDNYTSG